MLSDVQTQIWLPPQWTWKIADMKNRWRIAQFWLNFHLCQSTALSWKYTVEAVNPLIAHNSITESGFCRYPEAYTCVIMYYCLTSKSGHHHLVHVLTSLLYVFFMNCLLLKLYTKMMVFGNDVLSHYQQNLWQHCTCLPAISSMFMRLQCILVCLDLGLCKQLSWGKFFFPSHIMPSA